MSHFRDGRIAALVATTVIEVGVDVPNANIMIIDKLLRVVFDHDGIKFVNADYAINDEIVRRVGNLFYTRRFAELLLREVLIYNGKMKSVMQRIAIQVASQGCEIANLLPVHGPGIPVEFYPCPADLLGDQFTGSHGHLLHGQAGLHRLFPGTIRRKETD